MKMMSTKNLLRWYDKCKCILFILTLCASTNLLLAQTTEKVVTGVVRDSEQSTMPGVSVIVKGTNDGTITDSNGRYSINVKHPNAVLVFSFVGYSIIEKEIGDQSTIDISLQDNANELSEIVVTALGIKKESRVIGYATQEVKGEDLTKAREPNPINSLTGKVAGLTVGASPEMLGRPTMVLRGATGLLLVVDGVPINSDTWNVSADDIETYTVLKGPNAAALYGFRGQNGAILITTKKGSKDGRGFSVDFNSSTMAETGFLVLPEKQHEYGFGSGYQYAYSNDPYDAGGKFHRPNEWGPRFEGQPVKQYDSPILNGERQGTPWVNRGRNNYKDFMQTGILSTNNVSIGASGEKYNLRASLSHSYQKGMAPNTKLNVTNLNLSSSYDFSPKVKLETNINSNFQYSPNIPDYSSGPESYTYAFLVYGSDSWSVNDMKDYYKAPLGKPGVQEYFAEYGRENNPYFMAYEWLRSHNKTDVYGYTKLSYKLNDHLNISARTQITTWNQLRTEKLPYSMITYKSPDLRKGDYREDRRELFENNSDILVNYDKNVVPDLHVNASVGGNVRSFRYNSSLTTTDFLNVPGVYSFTNSLNPIKGYTFRSRMEVLSAYYSADFTFRNYVTLSTTGRYDKSSTLKSGYFYPSVALSTVISDFVKFPEVISFVKLRGSYANVHGALTSPTIGTAYQAVTGNSFSNVIGYGSELTTAYDGPNYSNQNIFTLSSPYNNTPSANYSSVLADPNLKPYSVSSYEGGLDLRFLNNRLELDATYFTTINGPLIYQLGVPSSTAFTARTVNAITTQKNGVELSLKGNILKNPDGLNWDVLVNWYTYKETLKSIGEGLDKIIVQSSDHTFKPGDRMDGYYGYKYIRDSKGEIIYKDGLPVLPSKGTANKQFLGNTNPDFVWSINNRFAYKNFSLSFQFDGRVGGVIYDNVKAYAMNSGNQLETATGALGDARLKEWQSTAQGTKPATAAYVGQGVVINSGVPQYTNGVLINSNELTFAPNAQAVTVQSYVQTTYSYFDEPYMISKTFAKLREVTIGYSIPSKLLANTFIKRASISLVGRNLLYFAKVKDFDMDSYANGFTISSSGTSSLQNPGLQTPTTRRFGVNVNLTF